MALVKLILDGTITALLSVSLEKQGERAIDQFKFELPTNRSATVNDSITYLQDIANLEYLTAIYNFQGILSDESGNSNNGTGTSITYGTDKWNGKSATFNGTTSRVTVAGADKFGLYPYPCAIS